MQAEIIKYLSSFLNQKVNGVPIQVVEVKANHYSHAEQPTHGFYVMAVTIDNAWKVGIGPSIEAAITDLRSYIPMQETVEAKITALRNQADELHRRANELLKSSNDQP